MTKRRIDWIAVGPLLVRLSILAMIILPLVLAACGPGTNGGGGGPGSDY